MKIEIWSDVVCPWCYIGKRHFEAALAQFQHRDQVEVIWRSYQLDPSMPKNLTESVYTYLAKKYHTSEEQAASMTSRVTEVAAQDGLEYHFEKAKQGNTFDAHRLIHLAKSHNLQEEAEERFFRAFFTEGAAISEEETLLKLITEVGVDEAEARDVLGSDAFADAVKADIGRARMFGIQGVPFFAINEKYGISGAQPAEIILKTLEQAWTDDHPVLKMVQSDETVVCDDETCYIPEDKK